MNILYKDPMHGWLRATKNELNQLGVADKISRFSYMNGRYAYLEEDCDARIFLRAKYGENYSLNELIEKGELKEQKGKRCSIRDYAHFAA